MTSKSLLTVVGTLIAIAVFGVVYLNYPGYFKPEAEDYYLLETVRVDYMTLSLITDQVGRLSITIISTQSMATC